MPTSITVAPGAIQSPRIRPGFPAAATMMSARRHSAARSRVRECPMMTVALAASNSEAIGRPTIVDRPTIRARAPSSATPACDNNRITPAGVQGTIAGSPMASRPTFSGWKPSTSFPGSIASTIACGGMCGEQRQLDQDAVHRRVGVELRDLGDQRLFAGVGRQPDGARGEPGGGRRAVLAAHVDRACRIVADQHHRETGTERQRGNLFGHSGSQVLRHAFSVDDARGHDRASRLNRRSARC